MAETLPPLTPAACVASASDLPAFVSASSLFLISVAFWFIASCARSLFISSVSLPFASSKVSGRAGVMDESCST